MLNCRQGQIELTEQGDIRKIFASIAEVKATFAWYEANQPGFVKGFYDKSIIMPYLQKPMIERPEVWGSLLAFIRAKHSNARFGRISANDIFCETIAKFVNRYNTSILQDDEAYVLARGYVAKAYTFIASQPDALIAGHFDLHPLNVFLDDNTFVFIDPRARFGNGAYGPLAYETSKVCYGMMLWPALSESPINQLCEKPVNELLLWPIEEILIEMSQLEKAWCVVHLLTAFGVFGNDPIRQSAAFYHGLDLVHDIIRFECEWL